MTEQIFIDRLRDGGQPMICIARNSKTEKQIARDDSDSGITGELDEFDQLIESQAGEKPEIKVIDRLRSDKE